MSLYKDYLEEITDDKILESEHAFATYRYLDEGKTVYIIDIFVSPKVRRTHYASNMIDEIVDIARDYGCTQLIATVRPTNPMATEVLNGHFKYGMRLKYCTPEAIVTYKDI